MKKLTLPKNATTNAVMFPKHWDVPLNAYIEIVAILVKNCPRWAEYYKRELANVAPLLEKQSKPGKLSPIQKAKE